MSSFEERGKAFEAKFSQDQERGFKVQVRCSYLFGKWAGEKMGLTAGDADAYANDVVNAGFRESGNQDVLKKVSIDLKSKGVEISDHVLRVELERFLDAARQQIEDES